MLYNVTKLFEFAPGKVALNINVWKDDLFDPRVGVEAGFDSIKSTFCQRITTQVNDLEIFRLREFHEELDSACISNLTAAQAHLRHVLTKVDGSSDALSALRLYRWLSHIDQHTAILHNAR